MKKLRQQKEENRWLKQMAVPEQALDIQALKALTTKKLVSPRRKDRRHIEVVERGIDLRRDDRDRQLEDVGHLFRILRRDGSNADIALMSA